MDTGPPNQLVIVVFGLPEPRTTEGPIHMQVAERLARKLGSGWAFVYTRHLRRIIQEFAEPGTDPKEDRLVYELLESTAATILKSGLDLIVTGVFAYDRYYSFVEPLPSPAVSVRTYRILVEGSEPTPTQTAIRRFHDKVADDFDIIPINVQLVDEGNMHQCIDEAERLVAGDLKTAGVRLSEGQDS